jgi:hypothetical protein
VLVAVVVLVSWLGFVIRRRHVRAPASPRRRPLGGRT